MLKVHPTSCQETIEKWVNDGMTYKEAVEKLEALLRCKLSDTIKTTVRVK